MARRRRRRIAIASTAVAAVAALAAPVAIHLSDSPTTPAVRPAVASTPTRGQVIPWQELPVNPVASFSPAPSETLVAIIDVASSVDPGTELPYTVVLENRSSRDIQLDPCPVFVQQLGIDGGTYLLNCIITALPANSWIRLEMQLRVSADAPAGAQTLSWSINAGGQTAAATANVTIR
jgi:hypothetical protein